MKKIMFAVILFCLRITLSFSQNATTTTTTTESTSVSTPVVKAADAKTDMNCPMGTGSSCCHSANKTAMMTGCCSTTTENSAATSKVAAAGAKCQSVYLGMSAAKPEEQKVEEEQK